MNFLFRTTALQRIDVYTYFVQMLWGETGIETHALIQERACRIRPEVFVFSHCALNQLKYNRFHLTCTFSHVRSHSFL